MAENILPFVGAPVLDAHAPASGSTAGNIYEWLIYNRTSMTELLDRAVERWSAIGTFLGINFEHPEIGPARAMALRSASLELASWEHRMERISVTPLSELAPYLSSWRRGRTVLVEVNAMPATLARRYWSTPIRWSLSAPVLVEGEWVGLVGAVAGERGFPAGAVRGFEALAQLLVAEYYADVAWRQFRAVRNDGRRLLRLLR